MSTTKYVGTPEDSFAVRRGVMELACYTGEQLLMLDRLLSSVRRLAEFTSQMDSIRGEDWREEALRRIKSEGNLIFDMLGEWHARRP